MRSEDQVTDVATEAQVVEDGKEEAAPTTDLIRGPGETDAQFAARVELRQEYLRRQELDRRWNYVHGCKEPTHYELTFTRKDDTYEEETWMPIKLTKEAAFRLHGRLENVFQEMDLPIEVTVFEMFDTGAFSSVL